MSPGIVEAARKASGVTTIEMIRPYIEQEIPEHLGVESITAGPDGTIPIPVDSTACIARFLEGPTGPMLRPHSPLGGG